MNGRVLLPTGTSGSRAQKRVRSVCNARVRAAEPAEQQRESETRREARASVCASMHTPAGLPTPFPRGFIVYSRLDSCSRQQYFELVHSQRGRAWKMKILLESQRGRPESRKRDKKSRKILKKMAKLEKKLSKYGAEDASSDGASSSDSSAWLPGRRRRQRDRSLSGSSRSSSGSSSSSSSSRSPSPQQPRRRRHGHLSRSRSFAGQASCPPVPASREDRHHRHHDHPRHHSSYHRELCGKPRHHRHHRYFRRCNNVVGGGLFRNLVLSDTDLPNDELPGTGDRRSGSRPANREPELVDMELEASLEEAAENPSDEAGGLAGAPEVDDALAENWREIVQNGLTKDKLQGLMRKHPIGKNRHNLLLSGPKLNEEIAFIASDAAARKDALQLNSQNKIGIGLSALSRALCSLNEKKSDPRQDEEIDAIVENLNDAAAVLLDAHYNATKIRQLNMSLELNRKAQAVLVTCKHDEFLFGKDLEEKARCAKGFEKCKKLWKNKNAGNSAETVGKRKHVCQEGEVRKSKRLDKAN